MCVGGTHVCGETFVCGKTHAHVCGKHMKRDTHMGKAGGVEGGRGGRGRRRGGRGV